MQLFPFSDQFIKIVRVKLHMILIK